jgi:hypothetical protein
LLAGTNENAPRNGSRVVVVTVPATMDCGARTVGGGETVDDVVIDVAAVVDVVAVVVEEGGETILPSGAMGAAVTAGAGGTPTLGAGATAETGVTTVGAGAAGTVAAATGNGETVAVEGSGAGNGGEAVTTDGVVTSGRDEGGRGERCRSPL